MFIEFFITFIAFLSTIFVYKFLVDAGATFLVPTISDVILASATFSVFLYAQGYTINTLIMITVMSILFSFVALSRNIKVILVKSVAYTILTIFLPLVDINYIDAIYSYVTGDPWPTFRTLLFTILSSLSVAALYILRREVTYTILDEESVKTMGGRPLLYKLTLILTSASVSLLLTSLYGFLGAHAIAFAAALLGGKYALPFALLASFISLIPLPLPPAYASAIALLLAATVFKAISSFRG